MFFNTCASGTELIKGYIMHIQYHICVFSNAYICGLIGSDLYCALFSPQKTAIEVYHVTAFMFMYDGILQCHSDDLTQI